MAQTHTYIGTFGTQYNRGPHPECPGLSGDHYVTVQADSLIQAHQLMLRTFGQAWAFIYPASDWAPATLNNFAPAGEYGRISPDGEFTINPQPKEAA